MLWLAADLVCVALAGLGGWLVAKLPLRAILQLLTGSCLCMTLMAGALTMPTILDTWKTKRQRNLLKNLQENRLLVAEAATLASNHPGGTILTGEYPGLPPQIKQLSPDAIYLYADFVRLEWKGVPEAYGWELRFNPGTEEDPNVPQLPRDLSKVSWSQY